MRLDVKLDGGDVQENSHCADGYSFKIVERRHCEDSTATFIEINYNYNPHVCTIDCVLHWGQVEQERILQRLTDLIQYFFEHHDHASDTGMFIVIEL